jgi:hypothetical protein
MCSDSKKVIGSPHTPIIVEWSFQVMLAPGHKCARCWRVLPEVGQQSRPGLCLRCNDAIESGMINRPTTPAA